jgi:integration host factor subunit beta
VIKSQLVLRIAAQNPHLSGRDAEKVVDAILDQIVSAMARRERVELRGFGTFGVKALPARIGHNPKTGAAVHVPEKITPAFRPGKEIRQRLNPDAVDT